MKVKILNSNQPGIAKGIDLNGNYFLIKGGDLCIGETIEVDYFWKNKKYLINLKLIYPDSLLIV
jgi:hypothetical protein